MRRAVTASIQSFSLPLALTLKDNQTDNGGLVDLTIKYYDVKGGHSLMTKSPSGTDGELQNQVTISVGILRATGLKDAALNACKDNPVSMAFAAEVGVNAYAKLKLPLLSAKVSILYCYKGIKHEFQFSGQVLWYVSHIPDKILYSLFRMNTQQRQSLDHLVLSFPMSLISHSQSSWVIAVTPQWPPRLPSDWNTLVQCWRCGTACLNIRRQLCHCPHPTEAIQLMPCLASRWEELYMTSCWDPWKYLLALY